MSGIYIKGMEMPTSCRDCPLEDAGYNCRIVEKSANWGLEGRPSWCPLFPVPEHGRLIDADAYESLLRGLGDRNYRREKGTICDAIKFLHPHYAPTIIPAEEGD